MKKLNLTLAIVTACLATPVFAATGTITFTGAVVAGTCTASVNGGTASQTVVLPTVNTGDLSTSGAFAGTTPFKITLTGAGCSSGTGPTLIATPYFEADLTKVNSAGRLIVSGGATNVDVQLLNNANAVIDASVTPVSQVTSAGTTVSPTVKDFNYFARYYATGAAGAGAVSSSVSYSIMYK